MAFKVIKENILKTNEDIAGTLRKKLAEEGTYMMNIISSPGAGKTSFLEKVAPKLQEQGMDLGILTGDCFTSRDAERLDEIGARVVQINTGNSCHIDAQLIKKALGDDLFVDKDLIIIENVGNLVCPAEFDLGEDDKIAILSTTEGTDKPVKYPLLFQLSALALINKMDLAEYTDFEIGKCSEYIKQVSPDCQIIDISCTMEQNIDKVVDWITDRVKQKKESLR